MKKMQENMRKKYSCDRSTTTTRLEDLLQDAAVSHGSSNCPDIASSSVLV